MDKLVLIKNKHLEMEIPEFNCDKNVVGKHLEEHELLKHLNCYGFTALIGKPRQGKTSLAIAMITQKKNKIYKKTHHKVIIMMPQNSINSLKKNPFKDLPAENFFNELSNESITHVENIILSNTAQGLKTLLFIDDMTADLKKSMEIQIILKRIVYNRRHLKTNIILTSQSYTNIPLDLRKNIENLFMFKPSKKEMQLLFLELIEAKKDSFMKIMRYAFNDAHDFLFVNIPSQRMFANFDEIISELDDDVEK